MKDDAFSRGLPRSRLGRVARLASLGVRTGAGALLGRGDDAVAAQAAEVLGNLRGLAAKVGQMASYVDGIVPEERRDAFEASLKVLRAAAPRSRPDEIRALVEDELGAPIDRLFDRFDEIPIASASIGQVHRARLPEALGGHDVAVKVQHPGIRDAVESDLANAGLLEGIAAVGGGRRFGSDQQLEVLRARFREELDYALEADRLETFARIHEGDETIRIPTVFRARSSGRVLTTELVAGRTLEDAARDDEAARRRFAETLWRFVFKGYLLGGMFNADPHPGNYLFQEDGRIAFLDYGCVQVISESRHTRGRAIHRAAVARDEAAFRAGVCRMVETRPGRLEDLAVRFTRACFEPLFGSPYLVTRAYAGGLLGTMREMAMAARKLPDAEVFQIPAEMLFMNRLQFGFYSVLARLDVEVDYAAVERTFLPAA